MQDNLRKCKNCNTLKSDKEFYSKNQVVYSKKTKKKYYYLTYDTVCKSCRSYLLKLQKYKKYERAGTEKEMNYNKGAEICETVYSPQQIHKGSKSFEIKEREKEVNNTWIISLLKRYGNCFINKNRKVSQTELEKALKKKLRVKPYENGFILEVKN